ncbi:S8 family serine peptidase [Microbacterium trichothecenolyticum]|uniref:Peptidase S8/S53 domain-containing protein n=1 Tax=Microbacterium trichothecenolyticum TaxID=69370 RepID=A0ABU0TU06_MICTR|nr:S8 family serine peptidase [Microbacterium trichothecenolyticum]MDQ1123141.1 hypothetical protein [Microbacterium trichothecenolyticum]
MSPVGSAEPPPSHRADGVLDLELSPVRTSVGFTLAFILVAAGVTPAALAAAPGDTASCRSIPVDADAPLRADIARARFGVDGSGVTVGVISDSFAATSPAGASVADDIANGLLPGAGNPCGRETPVGVVRDAPAMHDEGRAMLQLVHGIAPGASLAFAAADPDSAASVREAIDVLAAYGADIIVDDISVEEDAIFQRSLTAETVVRQTDRGVIYFSSAGNQNIIPDAPLPGQKSTPVNGWQRSAYAPTTCPDGVAAAVQARGFAAPLDCLDVDPREPADPTLGYSVLAHSELIFQWGEPAGAVTGSFVPVVLEGGVPVDVDLKPLADGTPGYTLVLPASAHNLDIEIVVARIAAPDSSTALANPPIFLMFLQSALDWAEYTASDGDVRIGRTSLGHNSDPAIISVAAAPWKTPFEVESFSGHGPSTHYFAPRTAPDASAVLDTPQIVAKPDVMTVDQVRQSVLGGDPDATGGRAFPGTSAAAPLAAAVAALAKSFDPRLTQEDVRALLRTTARPAASPWDTVPAENVTGAGLVDAEAALAALPPRPTPQPTPTAAPTPTSSSTPALTAAPAVGPTRLANSGTDASATVPLLIGAIALLVVGGVVLLIVRARARRR